MFMKPPEGGTPNRELPINALSCKRLKCYIFFYKTPGQTYVGFAE